MKHQSPKRELAPELTQEEFEAIERDIEGEIFDPEDAEYLHAAGVDDMVNK